MSQFSASGGQRLGVSASTSVLPVNIQDLFPLGWTGWISLLSKVGKNKWKLWNTLTLSSPVTLRIRVLCVEGRRHRCNIEEVKQKLRCSEFKIEIWMQICKVVYILPARLRNSNYVVVMKHFPFRKLGVLRKKADSRVWGLEQKMEHLDIVASKKTIENY